MARQKYRDFIEEAPGNDKENIYRVVEQQIVGDNEFLEKVEKKLGRVERPIKKLPLKTVINIVKEVTGIGLTEMISRKRGNILRIARSLLVVIAREMGYTMTELKGLMMRDISVLSRLSSYAERAECQKVLQRVKKKIIA